MKKIVLFLVAAFSLSLTGCGEVKNVARYENVMYSISRETGELTVALSQKVEDEYKTMNYVRVGSTTSDEDLINVFFIRKNAPDLLITYTHLK